MLDVLYRRMRHATKAYETGRRTIQGRVEVCVCRKRSVGVGLLVEWKDNVILGRDTSVLVAGLAVGVSVLDVSIRSTSTEW